MYVVNFKFEKEFYCLRQICMKKYPTETKIYTQYDLTANFHTQP